MKLVCYRDGLFTYILFLAKSDGLFKYVHGEVHRLQEQVKVFIGGTRLPCFSVTEHGLDRERNPLFFVRVSVLDDQVIFDRVHIRAESLLNQAIFFELIWQGTEQFLSALNEIGSINGLFLYLAAFSQDLNVEFKVFGQFLHIEFIIVIFIEFVNLSDLLLLEFI